MIQQFHQKLTPRRAPTDITAPPLRLPSKWFTQTQYSQRVFAIYLRSTEHRDSSSSNIVLRSAGSQSDYSRHLVRGYRTSDLNRFALIFGQRSLILNSSRIRCFFYLHYVSSCLFPRSDWVSLLCTSPYPRGSLISSVCLVQVS